MLAPLEQDLRRATRWPALDGVRGLAAVLVVAYHGLRLALETHHLDGPDGVPLILWPVGTLRFTIDAFFVLSGFLIVHAWQRQRELGHFYRRRARRLFPAYLVSVAVLVPLVAPQLLTSAKDLAALLTLQGYTIDGLTQQVDVPWWSLTTEIHFYLLVPLLALFFVGRPSRWLLLGGSIALAIWWWHAGAAATGLAPSMLPGRLHEFVIGALVGTVVRADHDRDRPSLLVRATRHPWTGRALLAALVVLGTYHGATFGHYRDRWFDDTIHVWAGLLLGALVLHALTRHDAETHWLCGTRLRGCGLVSYSLYLWHYPVLAGLVGLFAVGQVPLMAVPALLVGFGISAGLAVVSYRWVERPFLQESGRNTKPEVGTPVPAVTRTLATSST